MKAKTLKLFLSVVFIAVIGFLTGCNVTTTEPSYVTKLEVIESTIPVGKEVDYFAGSNYGMIELLVSYNDGSTKVVPLSAGIITEQVAKYFEYAGEHTITAYYEGKVTNFDIRIFPNDSEHYTYTFVYANLDSYQEAYLAGEVANKPEFVEAVNQQEIGWFTDAAFTQAYSFDSVVSKDLTLYQQVEQRYNRISFTEDGTHVVKELDVLCGSTVELYTPTLKGHTFVGWDYNGNAVTSLVMPQEDIKLNAIWDVNSYTVSYETNCEAEIKSETLEYGSKVTQPTAELSKEGYTFVGWSLDGEIVDLANLTVPAEDITLVAEWKINSYKVSFIAEDVKVVEVEYNSAIEFPEVTKEGHTFSFWAVDGKETTLTNVPAYDVEFVAVFVPNKYNVTFKAEGMENKVVEVTYGEEVKLADLIENPEVEGKHFLYWTLDGKPVETHVMTTKEVEFVAEFGINDYVLVIVNNTTVTKEVVKYQSEIKLPEPEEKAGYTFVGWQANVGEAVPTTMPASDVEITAVYEANKYTLTYDVEGTLTKVEYATDAKIEAIANPEKVGYTFVGWFVEDEKVELTTMPAHDLTVTAKFSINAYKLTYIVDEGVYELVTYNYNEEIVAVENPVKEGYDFIGWALNGEMVEIKNMPANDVTLVAVFEIEKFDLNYHFADFVHTTRHQYGEEVELLNLALQGYTLIGWTLDGEFISSGVITMPAHDVELIAVFEINTYTLTYVIDNVAVNKYVEYKAELGLPVPPVKEGYTFVGWTMNDEIISITTMPAKDITVFAKYEINVHTVTFVIEGESSSYELAYAENIKFPEEPTKVGHTFLGWSYEGILLPENYREAVMPDQDVTLVAEFVANDYKVTYVVDGQSSEEIHTYGTEISLPVLEKEGYTFKGWLNGEELITDGKYVIPASDTKLIAVFEINTYVLTLEILGTTTLLEYEYNELVVLPSAPDKVGYTYNGWSINGEYAGFVTEFNMPAVDFTMTCEYAINSYELTLVFGELVNTNVYEYNTEVTLPKLAKIGHTFIGWSDGETVTTDGTYTVPAHDSTLEAVFEINSYNLTTVIEGKEETVSVVYATELPLPEVPAKEGYEFLEWQLADGTVAPETMPANDITITAIYVIQRYEVAYENEGQVTTERYEYDTEIALPVLEKVGHTFNGWLLDGELIPTATIKVPAKDIKLVASYTVNNYELTTVIEGVETVTSVAYGSTLELPVIPEKEGHTIDGWYNGENKNTLETMPAENVKLVAKYIVNIYTITFDVLGVVTTKEVAYGTEITYAEIAEKVDYTFRGWFEFVGEEEVAFDAKTMPARDVSITAKYTRTTYEVTYVVEGEVVITETYYYLDQVKVSDLVPTKFGHSFIGWYVDGNKLGESFEMGRASVEITAQFKEYDYSYLSYELSNGKVIITGISGNITDGQVYIPSVMVISGVEYPVTTIQTQAFAYNTKISKVLINANVEQIEIYAFRACMNLVSVEFGPESKLANIGQYAFANCTALTSIVLPEGLTTISAYAFLGCSALTEIHIPSTVVSMGNSVFEGCSNLTIYVPAIKDKTLWAATWADGAKEVIE